MKTGANSAMRGAPAAMARSAPHKAKPPAGLEGSGWYFFPKEKLLLDHAAAQPVSQDSDGTRKLILPLADELQKTPAKLEGLLAWDGGSVWLSLPPVAPIG